MNYKLLINSIYFLVKFIVVFQIKLKVILMLQYILLNAFHEKFGNNGSICLLPMTEKENIKNLKENTSFCITSFQTKF